MHASDPIPRPLRDHLELAKLGVDECYVVLPRALAESMPLPWQQQMIYLLAEFHQAFGHLNWPVYRVVPSRHERLIDLDEDQLAEVGCIMEIDTGGELVYRERNGRRITKPDIERRLESQGLRYGDSTLLRTLARLVRTGRLTNVRDRRG